MTTFAEARTIVALAIAPRWPADRGTLMVAPDGFEDDHSWRVIAGAREALVDDVSGYVLDREATALLVDKATGALTMETSVELTGRRVKMRPVGAAPID